MDDFEWNDNHQAYREFTETPVLLIEPYGHTCCLSLMKLFLTDELIEPYGHTCCLSIMKLFLTDELIENIVDSTNKYVELMKQVPAIEIKMTNNSPSVYNLWNELYVDEIWCYVSIQLLMGIIHKPYCNMYWSKESLLSTSIFSTMMRRDIFEYIRKKLHFVDPLG